MSKSAKRVKKVKMKTVGILKLPETDIAKFLEALGAYGEDKSAAFLRRCAYALIKHHQRNERLNTPLSFELGQQPRQTLESQDKPVRLSHDPKNES